MTPVLQERMWETPTTCAASVFLPYPMSTWVMEEPSMLMYKGDFFCDVEKKARKLLLEAWTIIGQYTPFFLHGCIGTIMWARLVSLNFTTASMQLYVIMLK